MILFILKGSATNSLYFLQKEAKDVAENEAAVESSQQENVPSQTNEQEQGN